MLTNKRCPRCGEPVCHECGDHIGSVGSPPTPPRWAPPASFLKHPVMRWAVLRGEPSPDGAPVYTTAASMVDRQAFLDRLHPSDQVWFFSSPRESWQALAGTQGYAALRQGRIVDTLITAMN